MPGDGLAVVGAACVLLVRRAALDLGPDNLLVAVNAAEPLDAVLAALLKGGIRAAPDFVCAAAVPGAVLVLVRGHGGVTVVDAAGAATELLGQPVTTWVEARVDGGRRVSLSLAGKVELRDTPFQTSAGIVPASSVLDWTPTLTAGLGGPTSVSEVQPSSPNPADRAPSEMTQSPPPDDRPQQTPALLTGEAASAEAPTAMPQPDLRPPVPPAGPNHGVGPAAALAPSAPIDDGLDFSHLVEHTLHVGIEAAAVRDDDPSEQAWALPPLSNPDWPPTNASGGEAPETLVPPYPDVPAAPLPTPSLSGLIEQVPGLSPGEPGGGMGGRMAESRMHEGRMQENRGHEGRMQEGEVSPAFETFPPDTDDAELTTDVHALRAQRALADRGVSGPEVQAVRCPAGHPNEPSASVCRRCGEAITDRTVGLVARPSLGRLRFDTGQVVDLVGPLAIGRRPPTDALVDGEPARPVTIPDPDNALSRWHAEIRLEGWKVLLVDRRSVNGTTVRGPDGDVRALRDGEACVLAPGAAATLGDVVTFAYDVEPL